MAPEKGTQRNVECSNNCGIWSSVWMPDSKTEEIENKGFIYGFCNFSKIKELDQIMSNLKQLQLDITDITKDMKQNETSVTRIKTLEERDLSKFEANSATLLANVETEKKKQKDKESNVVMLGLKKLSKHEAEEKVKDILSYLDIETDPVKIEPIGTVNKQDKQLLLVKFPNPNTKWKVIRSPKKLRGDTRYDGIYINPDLTPEQRKLEFEPRNKLREIRISNPCKGYHIKSGQIVEIPQQQG